jgi:cytochrome c oxidase cbb3-type subunit 3
MSREKDHASANDSAYDGIIVLDGQLPQWWVWLLVVSFVSSLGYMLYFHVMGGPDQITEYKMEMAKAGTPIIEPLAKLEAATPPDPAPATPAYVYPDEASADEKILATGKDVYIKNCLACHAPDGGGIVGPNLADDYFVHGATYADSVQIIIKGVAAKGMIAWEGVLKPEEIHAVASYIWTFRGTEPSNPKPPEGQRASL